MRSARRPSERLGQSGVLQELIRKMARGYLVRNRDRFSGRRVAPHVVAALAMAQKSEAGALQEIKQLSGEVRHAAAGISIRSRPTAKISTAILLLSQEGSLSSTRSMIMPGNMV